MSKKAIDKLRVKYFGPYQVLEKCEQLAYKFDLPSGVYIHPIFHVSWLKRKANDPTKIVNYLPQVNEDGKVDLQPKSIIEYQLVRKGGRKRVKALVQ